MIHKILEGLLLFVVSGSLDAAIAQTELSQPTVENSPSFYLDLVNFHSSQVGKTRLDAYLKIPYDDLQFLKSDQGSYQSVFEVSMVVFDEDDFQTDGKIWRDTLIVNSYDATNSRRDFALTQATFDVPPSKYRIHVGLLDMDTHRSTFQKTSIIARDFATPRLAVSDVLIAEDVVQLANGKLLATPLVGAPRQENAKLFAYFEVYSKLDAPQLDVSYEIKNSHGDRVLAEHVKVERQGEATYLSIPLPSEKLPHDNYLIHAWVNSGKHQADSEHLFALRWEGIPASVADLELAIRQMRYIAKKDDLKKILESTADKQRGAFINFWRRIDPTPGTEQNELLDEYYRRINYANVNFGGFQEGWKTDRGMVYVLFGPPNDIDRNPFSRSPRTARGRTIKAYEIWTYYDLNRQFVFLDENGYGDYRLDYPFAIDQYLR